MPYSTRTDPRRKRTKRLSKSKELLEKAEAEARAAALEGRPISSENPKVVLRFVKKSEPTDAEKLHHLRMIRRGMINAFEQVKAVRRSKNKRVMNKGSARSRRGTFDDDPLITAHISRLVLDSGALIFGDGKFEEGKPGEPGKFVPSGTYMGEPIDMGPMCFGDRYVRFGKARFPGTDVRRFDQIPQLEENKGPLVPESGWRRNYPTRYPAWERGSGTWDKDSRIPKFVPNSRDLTTTILFRKRRQDK